GIFPPPLGGAGEDSSTIEAARNYPRLRSPMLSADAIVKLHDDSTAAWHAAPESAPDSAYNDPWLARVARQHRANFDLWHIEDEARTPGATDARLAGVKRRI